MSENLVGARDGLHVAAKGKLTLLLPVVESALFNS